MSKIKIHQYKSLTFYTEKQMEGKFYLSYYSIRGLLIKNSTSITWLRSDEDDLTYFFYNGELE